MKYLILLTFLAGCATSNETFRAKCYKDYSKWQQKQNRKSISIEETDAWCSYEQIRKDQAQRDLLKKLGERK